MKEMVNIRYKTIISHEDEKVSDEFEGEACHEFQIGKESWSFKHPTFGQIQIDMMADNLHLKHGHSEMNLTLNQKREIAYQTEYGTLMLVGLLKKLEKQPGHLRIVYYLYDGAKIISRCYLTLDVLFVA